MSLGPSLGSSLQRRTFVQAMAATLGGLALPTRAFAAPIDDALADLARARATLTTLQGPFTQERTVSLLATKVRSKGQLTMVRPDRLRWELSPPDAATYWVLPDALAYQTRAGSGRIARGASGLLGGVLEDLLILVGGDLAKLKGRYDLMLVRRDAGGMVVHATPKDPAVAKTTQRIELETGADLAVLTRVSIVEAGSDRSDIVFGVLTRNETIDPKLVAGP